MTKCATILLEGHIKALRDISNSMRQNSPDEFQLNHSKELENIANKEEVYLILQKGNYV